MSAPARTIGDIDADLRHQRLLLTRAVERMAATSAQLTLTRIDQLLDERLTATPR